MNPRELLENIDNLDFDDNEINDVEMTDIIKERARKKVKSIIRHRKAKKMKITVAMVIGIFSLGVVSTPAIASNIPVLSDLYRKIGIFDDFKDYKKFIGTTKEDKGYKATIEEMLVTPNTMIVAVKVQSPTPFSKDSKDHLGVMVDTNKLGMNSASGIVIIQYIDDYNCLIINEADNMEGLYPEKSNISIKVNKLNEELQDEFNITFDINANFKSSFNDIDKFKINKSVENVKIKSLTSSIIKSNLFIGTKDLDINLLTQAFAINVDGRYHPSTGISFTDNYGMMEFKTLRYPEVNKAKSISVIYTGLRQSVENDELVSKEVELEEDKGITYPKEIIINSNKSYKISKVERESSKVKFYVESKDMPIDLISRLTLGRNSETDNIFWYGTMYKGDSNNYIIEFDDTDNEGTLKLNFMGYSKWKSGDDFEEIKIK